MWSIWEACKDVIALGYVLSDTCAAIRAAPTTIAVATTRSFVAVAVVFQRVALVGAHALVRSEGCGYPKVALAVALLGVKDMERVVFADCEAEIVQLNVPWKLRVASPEIQH